MSAYVIALVATGAITAAAALVGLVAVLNRRQPLTAKAHNPQLQRELAEVQRQIDRGRNSL